MGYPTAQSPLPPGEGWVRVWDVHLPPPIRPRRDALTLTLSRGERGWHGAARRPNHLHFACILLATVAFGTRHISRNHLREDGHELRSCGDGAPPRQRADERRRMAGPLRSRRLLSARLPQRLIRRLDREDPGYRT